MGKHTVLGFLREQWTELPVSSANIGDKSLLVVGANAGLGFEASVHLALLKPGKLLLTCRDEIKCDQTKREVEQRSKASDISSWPLELNSFESVRTFVDRFETEGGRLDVLVANAGVSRFDYTQTQDGWETTLQVNYLSTALLSILMLPHLIASSTPEAASRLLIVSSEAHYLANRLKGANKWPSILGKLNDVKYCSASIMRDRYNISKLLEIMFMRELAARLPFPTPVSVSAINPGFCHSNLAKEIEASPLIGYPFRAFKGIFARSTEMGSRTLVHPAVAPNERTRHGRYLSSYEVTEESDYVLSDEGIEISKRLWAETLEVLGKVDGRVTQIVSQYLSP
ncbi:short-chain dehydrogenase [Hygrophoropsis aurantiaca]|uniref:Short-chain dehydrogenase n=1 Tax=Hygrophoropsis aurantiaca TaxID=72124 RepID=A0ACB8AIJ0_9AGAM|nr:short-chain dehydrogenase [Hygrophoropsis aurantiaca]